MEKYNPQDIEKKWQKVWDENADKWQAQDFSNKPKFYTLFEFPYPSGDGLHMGHLRGQTAVDVYARKKRLEGFNVMTPIGWDAFGLPTENYAIKHKIQPAKATADNIASITKQEKMLGYFLDWNREINTTDPNYYKWTQWIFLQLFKHGLAYKADMPINWCPKDKIGLANEEVINGCCERCGTAVIKRNVSQWLLRITKYADKLIDGLKELDFPDRVKTQQINWIGRSEGARIKFKVESQKSKTDHVLEVFTTRPDTLFGVTFMVVSPEHSLISNIKNQISNIKEVEEYIQKAKSKSDLERTDLNKNKTGVELKSIKAVNPINNAEIPIFVADYVLTNYGTGAIMAVPAHDERDWEFARKYNLPITQVIAPQVTYYKTPPKPELKYVERNVTETIVYNPKTNKYLCLKWKNQPWTTFITGGVDEGENYLDAAKREIKEETGYKNVKLVKSLGHTKPVFHAAHKNENRVAFTEGFLFELIDDEREEMSKEEQAIHEVIWLNREELKIDNIVCASFDFFMAEIDNKQVPFCGYGSLVNSGEFDNMESREAAKKITEKLKSSGVGEIAVNYKLRDWIFSRQHYWGEPIPIIHCPSCGMVSVPEDQLPVLLPEVEQYEPTDNGESPLAKMTDWVNTTCPKCGGEAKRETDTMPNWAGSSWYFLRYIDPENNNEMANFEKLKYWLPVDMYEGGMEHTTLHLLYSRFWNEFLFDIGVVPVSEPYQKRVPHGIILAADGRKMSKSLGNVVKPDEIVKKFGADTARTYAMFIGPFDQTIAWDENGLVGVSRFLNRVWENMNKPSEEGEKLVSNLQQLISSVSGDIELFSFNTAVAKLMEFNNLLAKESKISSNVKSGFLRLLYPFAPHLCEELWERNNFDLNVYLSSWPVADETKIKIQKITMVIQVNSKNRDEIEVSPGLPNDEVSDLAKKQTKIAELVKDKQILKTIVVKDKLINFVVV